MVIELIIILIFEDHLPQRTGFGLVDVLIAVEALLIGLYSGLDGKVLGSTCKNFFILNKLFESSADA